MYTSLKSWKYIITIYYLKKKLSFFRIRLEVHMHTFFIDILFSLNISVICIIEMFIILVIFHILFNWITLWNFILECGYILCAEIIVCSSSSFQSLDTIYFFMKHRHGKNRQKWNKLWIKSANVKYSRLYIIRHSIYDYFCLRKYLTV